MTNEGFLLQAEPKNPMKLLPNSVPVATVPFNPINERWNSPAECLYGKNADHLKCKAVLVTVSVLLTARYWPSGDTGTILRGITTKR